VPEDIKTWIKITVGTLYDNPQAVVMGGFGQTMVPIPRTFFDALLDDYRYKAMRFA
jgi:hypothetical protein